jgi:allene oxide cyclase
MSRILVVVAIAATAALLAAVTAIGAGSKGSSPKTLTVVEHATTDTTTDTGASGDSAGDLLTFGNDVFDAKDAKKAGTDQGSCIRVVPGVSYECTWTTLLPGGQITVEGPFYDKKNSTLAITGGTGRYRNARGTMDLESRSGGTKYGFVFHMIG